MAMNDWNHDGENNYVDDAVDMMILDDIENGEKSSGGSGNSSGQGCSGIILGIIVIAIILIIT